MITSRPTPINKGGAMTQYAMTPGQSQGPTLFNPNSTMNLGGAMTPNPTQEMDRTIGRGAGEFGIQGRSLVPSKDLKSRGRSL